MSNTWYYYSLGRLQNLPPELVSEIFAYLPLHQILEARATSLSIKRTLEGIRKVQTLMRLHKVTKMAPRVGVGVTCVTCLTMYNDSLIFCDEKRPGVWKMSLKNGDIRLLTDPNLTRRNFCPFGIAPNAKGEIFVSDQNSHTISKLILSPTRKASFEVVAGMKNKRGYLNGHRSKFWEPRGICFDHRGNLLIADNSNHCVRSMSPLGVVSTIAGRNYSSGYQDGPVDKAKFTYFWDIAVHPTKDLFFIRDQSRIRAISNGFVRTVYAHTTNDWIYGMTVDKRGDLYYGVDGKGIFKVLLQDTLEKNYPVKAQYNVIKLKLDTTEAIKDIRSLWYAKNALYVAGKREIWKIQL
mmetsp:Transcript_5092/g.5546  ORF Transcript_5092/g.5546 Transcript_5092/m.5546 type:complete len:352 (-) Transcript_5092:31-1086(-)